MTLSRFFAAVAIWCLPAAAFAGPRDDLLRLVPDDYTFCFVAHNLRDLAKSGDEPTFLKALEKSPLLKQFEGSPEAKKFEGAVDAVLKGLGVTPEQIWNDILGDAIVFAYRKGPAGHEDQEDGLFLIHARDAKLLARLVDRINELQTKDGDLKSVEPVDGKPARYFRRVKSAEKEKDDFYALHGNRLIFASNEELLKSMVARLEQPGKDEPPLVQRLKKLGVNDVPIAFLINPRAFDSDLADSIKKGKAAEQRFLKEFTSYWAVVYALAISVSFSPAIEIGLSMNVRKERLPKAAAQYFSEAGKRSPLWDRIPDDALFACVGRVHVESMAAMLGGFLTDPNRAEVLEKLAAISRPFLEADDFGPLIRGLGPDAGLWITRPDPADKTWCPQGMLAVKTADNQDGRQAEQSALRGLDFLARLACLSEKELRFRTEKQGDVEVRYLTNMTKFPPGFRPGFASKGGYVLVASSPQTIARFIPPTSPAIDAEEVPILRISVAGWRAYLKDHRKGLAEFLAAANKTDPETLNAQIDHLMPFLEALDRIEVVQRSGPERVTLLLRLQPTRK